MDRHVKRDYESDDLIVHWDSSKCIHCGKCVMGLPAVFNLQKHPWIDVAGASSEQIATQVGRCPSGALSVTVK